MEANDNSTEACWKHCYAQIEMCQVNKIEIKISSVDIDKYWECNRSDKKDSNNQSVAQVDDALFFSLPL